MTNQAFWLGQMELLGDYHRADNLIQEIEAVTPGDVQRIAQTYLTRENRTVGWLVPAGDETSRGGAAVGTLGAVKTWGLDGPRSSESPGSTRAPFERRELANGIVLLGQPHPDDPRSYFGFRIGAGAASDPRVKAGSRP